MESRYNNTPPPPPPSKKPIERRMKTDRTAQIGDRRERETKGYASCQTKGCPKYGQFPCCSVDIKTVRMLDSGMPHTGFS
jgi:hypothetical protein